MKELTREQAEHILRRNHIGRLACYSPSRDALYIVPISYAYHDESIYFGSLEGQKLAFLREHPSGVCFEVDEITNDQTWLCVIVSGRFVELQGSEREAEIPSAVDRALRGAIRESLYTDTIQTDYQRAEQHLQVCAIRVGTLTAREDRWSWDVDFGKSMERAST